MWNNIWEKGFASHLIRCMTLTHGHPMQLSHKHKGIYFNVCLNYYYGPTKETSSDEDLWLRLSIHFHWDYRSVFNCHVSCSEKQVSILLFTVGKMNPWIFVCCLPQYKYNNNKVTSKVLTKKGGNIHKLENS